jgi:hypothetical protein
VSGQRLSERTLRERGVALAEVILGVLTYTTLMELCSLGVYHRHEAKANGRPIYHNENGRYMMYHYAGASGAEEWRVAQRQLVDEALTAADKGGEDALMGSSGDRKWTPGPLALKCASKKWYPDRSLSAKFTHEGGWAADPEVKGSHPDASQVRLHFFVCVIFLWVTRILFSLLILYSFVLLDPDASQHDLLHALISRDSSCEAEIWARAMRDAGTDELYESPPWALQDDPRCDATWAFEVPRSLENVATGNAETKVATSEWKVFDAVSVEILTRAYVRRLPEVSLPHLPGGIVVNLGALYREHGITGVIR